MFDPGIVSQMASGDAKSRALFTKILYRISFSYHYLTAADKAIIEAHQDHVHVTAAAFDLRNPYTDEDWNVRLSTGITFKAEPRWPDFFSAEISCYGSEVNKMKTAYIAVEDLGAGVDIASRPIFSNRQAVTINSIGNLTQGAPAGIDDSNTAVIAIKNDAAATVVSKTYNTATQPPSSDDADLGTITNGSLAAGQHLTLSVTQGATANLPAFILRIEYYLTA
jgi:hypothetical protein